MCNLYRMTATVDEMRRVFGRFEGDRDNLPSFGETYPNYKAPVLRRNGEGLKLEMMTWGFVQDRANLTLLDMECAGQRHSFVINGPASSTSVGGSGGSTIARASFGSAAPADLLLMPHREKVLARSGSRVCVLVAVAC